MITLEEKENNLLSKLAEIPPNFVAATQLLNKETFTSTEITKVALGYADKCFCEVGDFARDQGIPHPKNIIPNLHSTHIVDVINFLLQQGLDPNDIYDDSNIMDSLYYVDNEYLSADAMVLLLEHGGKTDLVIPGLGESLFSSIDFDVFFAAVEQYDRQRYASFVHCWMVLIGYGARCGGDKMQVFKEYDSEEYFDFEKLKKHRNYFFGVTHLENDFAISIFDKDTLWEVARIK